MCTTPTIFKFKKTKIKNHLDGRAYQLRRMADLEATDEFLSSVVSVCNEPQVYDWLFRERLQGKPYPLEDAGWFKEWGTQGWEDNTHFLFIVTDDLFTFETSLQRSLIDFVYLNCLAYQ